ncbi:MAG: prolipoprotein diacylglyceryl transferase [Candidatus Shapirobacteria bacterium]|nr:prolipoprotein diacylglyceryl transferase [Candidatus Shapirobacteria bacterium]
MHIYGLILGICFVVGINYFQKNNKVIPQKKENIFLILLLIFGVIGARTYSIIQNWHYFSQNPIQILNLPSGGLGIYGGLIFGILFIFFFSKKNKISFLKITNTLIPIIPLCQSLGRFGNFFNHEIYGINNQPVWFYESILLFILFLIFQKIKTNQTVIYLIYYGTIRFFLEFIRLDTIPIYSLTFAQILSLSFILIGFIIFMYENSSNKPRLNQH